MNHFSELRSVQDRELLAREMPHRHPAPPRTARPTGLAARLLRLAGARRALRPAPAARPRECAPAHDA